MRRFFVGIGTLVLFCNGLLAQFNVEDFKDLPFRNIGPAGMSGRITAIDVDLQNPQRIFVGAASGGVWLSENGGISWKPVFDEQACLAIGSIKINPKNPAEIWVGTGEGNPRNSSNQGKGIYKSIDGGLTWKNMGLTLTKSIHRIIIHRDNSDVVFAAALGNPWGPHKERGVYKTTDGGKTWRQILFVNELTGAADLVVDPVNPNKILVSMWEHQRKPWFFHSGGKGSGLYLSYDGGENFKKLGDEDGLPKGDLGRIGLAFASNKPNIIYALIEAKENGLYKSTDGGKKWTLVSSKNIGDRPFYYSELYVDPQNENRIYNVYTYLSKSEDGGKTFKEIANYSNNVHPDHHALWIHSQDPNFIIDGNDGGLAISKDGGEQWDFINNIPVGQFYHINIDQDFPFNVYGGMQDNGSWVGPSSVLKRGGISNHDFQELYFGDGFDVVPYPKDSRYGYAMSQGGNVAYYDRLTGRSRFIKPNHPDTNIVLRYNWNAAIAQDPFLDCGVYFGSQFVHYSKDCGESWNIISPDLTTNDTTKQKADQSGGLTLDATFAENHTTILCIAPSPVNKNVLWVGTDDGQLQSTTDGGKTWVNSSKLLKGLPAGSWIPQIVVSPKNEGEAWVIANDYRRQHESPYLFHTQNMGKSWRNLVDDTQIKGFTLSFAQDHQVADLMFLGTDVGLYVSFDGGKKWHHLYKNFPQVQVTDLKIHPREDALVIGTFGRAIWIMDDLQVLRDIAKNTEAVLEKPFKVFDTSPGYLVSYRSYDGVRFAAQGEFKGSNISMDKVSIYVWKKPKAKHDQNISAEEDKEDKINISVYDASNNLIRTFKRKPKDGLGKFSWGLERDGIVFPSNSEPKDDEDAPNGEKVSPGKYKIIVAYKGQKDSLMAQVKPDPRLDPALEKQKSQHAAFQRYEDLVRAAKKNHDALKECKKSIQIVEKLLVFQTDSIQKKFKALHKDLYQQIDSLSGLFVEPENQKGIQRKPNRVNSILGTAYSYLQSSWGAPEKNALLALDKAAAWTTRSCGLIEQFLKRDWAEYQVRVKNADLTIFSK